jgi:hypothetical protein
MVGTSINYLFIIFYHFALAACALPQEHAPNLFYYPPEPLTVLDEAELPEL